MANNRLYIRCKGCGESIMITKNFGEPYCLDKKLLISPEEALKRIKELSEDLSRGWVDIYADNADEEIIEALSVAIACLEEKCHE